MIRYAIVLQLGTGVVPMMASTMNIYQHYERMSDVHMDQEPELPLLDVEPEPFLFEQDELMKHNTTEDGLFDVEPELPVFDGEPLIECVQKNNDQGPVVDNCEAHSSYTKTTLKVFDWVYHKKYEEGKVTEIRQGKDGDVVVVRFLKPGAEHREHFAYRFPAKNFEQQVHVEILVSRKYPNKDFSKYKLVPKHSFGVIQHEYEDHSYLVQLSDTSSDTGKITIRALPADLKFAESVSSPEEMESVQPTPTSNSECFVRNIFKMVKELVSANGQVDDSERSSFLAHQLFKACENGDDDGVEQVMNHGANVHELSKPTLQKKDGWYNFDRTALHFAANGRNVAIIEQLISAGVNFNRVDHHQFAALHVASEDGHTETVEKIIEFGNLVYFTSSPESSDVQDSPCGSVDINVAAGGNHSKDTALHVASKNGHTGAARILVEHGANVNLQNSQNAIALHMASEHNHLEIVRMLISAAAPLDIVDELNRSALYLAFEEVNIEIVDMLIACGANVGDSNKYHWTDLQRSVIKGYTRKVEQEIKRGVDLEALDSNNKTFLHLACKRDRLEVVDELIKAGINVNAFDNRKTTALHIASMNGNDIIVDRLIAADADLDLRNEAHSTALHIASQSGHDVVAENLIFAGSDVNLTDDKTRTPLHWASYCGHEKIVEKLITARADVNLVDWQDSTAIHLASKKGYDVVVGKLIAAGGNVNFADDENMTALHRSAEMGHDVVVGILISAGADVNHICVYNHTPLNKATMFQRAKVVNMLTAAGSVLAEPKPDDCKITQIKARYMCETYGGFTIGFNDSNVLVVQRDGGAITTALIPKPGFCTYGAGLNPFRAAISVSDFEGSASPPEEIKLTRTFGPQTIIWKFQS